MRTKIKTKMQPVAEAQFYIKLKEFGVIRHGMFFNVHYKSPHAFKGSPLCFYLLNVNYSFISLISVLEITFAAESSSWKVNSAKTLKRS